MKYALLIFGNSNWFCFYQKCNLFLSHTHRHTQIWKEDYVWLMNLGHIIKPCYHRRLEWIVDTLKGLISEIKVINCPIHSCCLSLKGTGEPEMNDSSLPWWSCSVWLIETKLWNFLDILLKLWWNILKSLPVSLLLSWRHSRRPKCTLGSIKSTRLLRVWPTGCQLTLPETIAATLFGPVQCCL